MCAVFRVIRRCSQCDGELPPNHPVIRGSAVIVSTLDCHSRPAHKLHTPNEAVDLALLTRRLGPKTPWVTSKVVAALVKPYATKAEAEKGIANSLREAYPDPAQANPIIKEAQAIYREHFFPGSESRLADVSRFCWTQEL